MRSLLPITLICSSITLAACGSSSSSSSSTGNVSASSNATAALAFASCMRSHGVPNFPDPTTGGPLNLRVQSGPNGTNVNGVEVNGPAFQSAMQACRSQRPGGGNPQPPTISQRAAALRFSQCMRSHGLTNFPDPIFTGRGVRIAISRNDGLDPNSPAFKSAQAACGALLGKGAPGP